MRTVLTMTLVIILALAAGGCSSFRSSRHIDMSPFAEHTISLVADISYGLNRQHAVHLRKYMDDPEVHAYQEGWESMRTVLRGVAAYSLAIVTVSKSNLSEQEKVEQLAGFLDRLKKPVADAPVVEYQPTSEGLDRILADIRQQENLLDGLGAAQPIVDWVAWYAGVKLDSLKVMAHDLEDHLLEQVEADFAGVVEFNDVIRDVQVMTLRSALLLSKHRGTGDPEYIAQIRETDLSEALSSRGECPHPRGGRESGETSRVAAHRVP